MINTEKLTRVFERYKNIYCNIFNTLYPSKNSTGFTERNLSVNFSKAYESEYPHAITWFEFQFGKNNSLHYDALIIDPVNKDLYLIESKRFSKLFSKIREVQCDIERINDAATLYKNEFSNRIDNFSEYTMYGIILADVWTENKNKTKVKRSFENSTFAADFMPELYNDKDNKLKNAAYFIADFTSLPRHCNDVMENDLRSIRQNYNLLSIVWKLT